MKRAHNITLLALALSAGPALAQYTGPSAIRPASVAQILQNPTDDQPVMLQGHLLKKVGRKRYDFSDGTGTIRVEIDDRHFPPGVLVNDKTRIELHGEIEKDFMTSPEVDVDTLRVLPSP